MKKFFLLTLFAVCPALLAAQTVSVADTVVRVHHADSVIVVETDSVTEITVYGKKDTPSYFFKYRKSSSPDAFSEISEHAGNWDVTFPLKKKQAKKEKRNRLEIFSNVHLGIDVPVFKSSDMKANFGWNLGMEILGVSHTFPNKKDCIGVGFGVEAHSLRVRKGRMWLKQDGELVVGMFPEEMRSRHSRLVNASLSFPVSYSHKFSHTAVEWSVRPEYNLNSRIYNRYKLDSEGYRKRIGGIKNKPWGMSVRMALDNDKIFAPKFFLQYSPFHRFQGQDSPRYQLFTFGIVL